MAPEDMVTDNITSHQLAAAVTANVRAALAEDLGDGDRTGRLIDPALQGVARIVTREKGVFCGKPWVDDTCRQVGELQADWRVDDGEPIAAGQTLFLLRGQVRAILAAERTLLNFVQLLSGTASETARLVGLLADADCTLLDTRKTLPGLRLAQKHAVRCGGGGNHRLGLHDACLIKENHIAAAGGIAKAVARCRNRNPGLFVEVEVESLAELAEALQASPDRIMLDNFSLADAAQAVALANGRIPLEASGGLDDERIVALARMGIDFVSVGALTKRVLPLDLSLRLESTRL